MKKLLTYLAISVTSLCAYAQQAGRIEELDKLSNEELIVSVPLGKHADLVRAAQEKEATRLINGVYAPAATGCNVETYRNHEVIIITIPAGLLFAPNDTELMEGAEKYLSPLKRYARTQAPDLYRMLLVMHTDDTGSTSYTDSLSVSRVESVYEFLDEKGLDTRYVFPTAAGATDPIHPNNTMAGRAGNRRLEIYLIPGTRMLDEAKKGRIAF